MANILSILKVTPSSPEYDRPELVEKFRNEIGDPLGMEILKYDEEPLAFGLYNLKLYVRSPDTEEGSKRFSEFETKILDLEEVAECEVELQTLMDH